MLAIPSFWRTPPSGRFSKQHDDIEPGSDIQFGYLLEARVEEAPRQERFFKTQNFDPDKKK